MLSVEDFLQEVKNELGHAFDEEMENRIPYFLEEIDEYGFIHSIDMVRIKFEISEENYAALLGILSWSVRPDITAYPINTAPFKYKHLFVIKYETLGVESVLTIGLLFNGSNRETTLTGFIEFNPNKVGLNGQFWDDYHMLKDYMGIYTVSRIDYAVDIPIERKFLFLEKDQRRYELVAYSADDRTEWLGVRNQVGRCKIYNKKLESRLSFPCTRIEVTVEPTVSSVKEKWPSVFDLSFELQMSLDSSKLNGTELYILESARRSVLDGSDPGLIKFKSLVGRKYKEKLKPYLLPEPSRVLCDYICVGCVLSNFLNKFNLVA